MGDRENHDGDNRELFLHHHLPLVEGCAVQLSGSNVKRILSPFQRRVYGGSPTKYGDAETTFLTFRRAAPSAGKLPILRVCSASLSYGCSPDWEALFRRSILTGP